MDDKEETINIIYETTEAFDFKRHRYSLEGKFYWANREFKLVPKKQQAMQAMETQGELQA